MNETAKRISLATMSLLSFLMGMVPACRPSGFEIGGGGITHIPPVKIDYGEATDMKLELSTWGEGYGRAGKKWRDVTFHYKTDTGTQYHSIPMRLDKEEPQQIYLSCKLPPVFDPNAQSITYYFDMVLDGHYNKREQGPISIQHVR